MEDTEAQCLILNCSPCFWSNLVNKWEEKNLFGLKQMLSEIEVNFGENLRITRRITRSIPDIVTYHIWAFLVAARGSRSRGHF